MTQEHLSNLVLANHILVHEGVLDGFGHISVRDPANPQQFFIARSMAPALVTEADLVTCNLDGEVIAPAGAKTYVERFIHSEIYKARPDVHSVVHSHSPAVIPFGVTGARLRPICHMSGFLGATVPVYEIRRDAGETSDLLIRNQALGRALADSLGSATVALMRGHGSVTVGVSIQQAVFRAIYTENSARLQLEASRLGEINFLTDGEAQATSDMNDQHLDRPWQMWVRRVRAAG
jgi:ribulose-5-phosphate 4-epimerase/fuculose-1-phosphate aldolase